MAPSSSCAWEGFHWPSLPALTQGRYRRARCAYDSDTTPSPGLFGVAVNGVSCGDKTKCHCQIRCGRPSSLYPRDVEGAVPLLASFSLNRINWEHPGLQSREQQFSTRHGLGLSVHIIAEADSLPDDGIDSTGLLQSSLSSLLPAVSHLQPATEWFKAHLYLMLFCWCIYIYIILYKTI